MNFRKITAIGALACAVALPAFALPFYATATAAAGTGSDHALADAVAGTNRSPKDVARDKYRHPLASLQFWGLKPGDTILEVWPGGGYWTDILAPYAKATNGKYIAALAAQGGYSSLPAKFSDKSTYGDITTTVFDAKSGPFAQPGTADFLLTARNVHNWMWTPGFPKKAFADFYAALKPGGILAVEEHRADPRPMVKDARDGYMSTASVIKLAEDAGFKYEAQSEINANPKDTKDHPFGVWTLPPTRWSVEGGKPDNPNFDHTKYDAIGESDRMTLRFRKPM